MKHPVQTTLTSLRKPNHMKKKIFVLDTNVLLNDCNAINSFKEHDVVLPLMVLEELDNHKTRLDEAGKNGRESVRKILELRKLGSLFDGVSLGDKKGKFFTYANSKTGQQSASSCVVEHEPTKKEEVTKTSGGKKQKKAVKEKKEAEVCDVPKHHVTFTIPEEFSEDKNDNSILLCCLELKTKNPKIEVVLVSNDALLQIKADAIGIKSEEYKKFNTAEDADSMYSGISNITVADSFIDGLYLDPTVVPLDFYDKQNLSPNQFLVLKGKSQGKSAICKFVDASRPLRKVDMNRKVWNILPKNKEQSLAIDLLMDDNIQLVTLIGKAGSGKSLLALAAALQKVIEEKRYEKIIILRPVQSLGKELGFLPGSEAEKLAPWIEPAKDNLRFLLREPANGIEEKGGTLYTKKKKSNMFGEGNSGFKGVDGILGRYFEDGTIEIQAMSYIRGRTIPNAFFIIDEAQNVSPHEMKTMLTRAGEGTKIVCTGDVEQLDRPEFNATSNGLAVAIDRFKSQPIAGHLTLIKGERSALASIAGLIL